MDKKSIGELRRRLKKDSCTFTKVTGCYIDDQKNKVTIPFICNKCYKSRKL